MMYYLGYYNNLDLTPINLESTNGSILSVVDYTTKFDNLNSLKKSLLSENKIPSYDVHLCYLIAKGKKGHKYYEEVKSDRVYTIESSAIFNLDGIKKFITTNKYNEDMIVLLLSAYLRKFGYSSTINQAIKNKCQNATLIIPLLKEIRKVSNESIQKIIDYIINNYYQLSKEEISNRIDYLISLIEASNSYLVNVYLKLKSSVEFRNIPTINYLCNWLRIAHDHNVAASYYQEIPSEYRDIDSEVNSFISSIVYDYDPKTRDYKKVNGKRKINERPLFDLGVIIEPFYKLLYDKYIASVYECDDDEYDDDAEFLCEDDFARCGTTSEEEGIKLRKVNR